MYTVPGDPVARVELQTPIGGGNYLTRNKLEFTNVPGFTSTFTPMLLGLIVQHALSHSQPNGYFE